MNEKRWYWAATLFGCIALSLFVVNMVLEHANMDRGRKIQDQQAAINRGAALHQLTIKIADELNEIGNKYDDRRLCETLRAEGMPTTGKCGMLDKTGNPLPTGHAGDR